MVDTIIGSEASLVFGDTELEIDSVTKEDEKTVIRLKAVDKTKENLVRAIRKLMAGEKVYTDLVDYDMKVMAVLDRRKRTLDDGEKALTLYYLHTVKSLTGYDCLRRTREWPEVALRRILFKILNSNGFSTQKIGSVFGLNHTTVISGLTAIDYAIAHPKQFGRINGLGVDEIYGRLEESRLSVKKIVDDLSVGSVNL